MNRKKIVLTVDGEKFDSWDKSGESIGYIIDACDCNIESINPHTEIKRLANKQLHYKEDTQQ